MYSLKPLANVGFVFVCVLRIFLNTTFIKAPLSDMVLTTKYGFSLLGFPSSLQMGILGYWDFVPTREGEEGLPIPSFYQFFPLKLNMP